MRIVLIFMFASLLVFAGCASEIDRSVKPAAKGNVVMDHQKDFYVAHKGLEDGYELIFHIMPAPEGMGYSRSDYHLMVRVEKGGQVVRDILLYSQVKHPDGSTTKRAVMMQMGGWYMARYNLSHEQGRHWLMVSFVQGGKEYEAGVYYPEIDFRATGMR